MELGIDVIAIAINELAIVLLTAPLAPVFFELLYQLLCDFLHPGN